MNFSELELRDIVTQELNKSADFAFLMGSAGTERFNSTSDIDLAVFWNAECSEGERTDHHRTLEEKFRRDLDVVSLNSIDIIFARQVLETGRLLFCNSPGVLLNWKMQKLSEYPDFKVSRKPIEDNILKRKKYV
jgi:predicted nucleotidyltransferase